jgi:hypothetical protein
MFRTAILLSTKTAPVIDDIFRGFKEFFYVNTGAVPSSRPWPLPFKLFPIYYSLIILTLNAIQTEKLKAILNKQ